MSLCVFSTGDSKMGIVHNVKGCFWSNTSVETHTHKSNASVDTHTREKKADL